MNLLMKRFANVALIVLMLFSWTMSDMPRMTLVDEALAVNWPGDYMIRRNDAETDSVTTSNLDATWDTEVGSRGASISYSAGTFTLASGKYLVMYSERFDTLDTTNNQRVEIQSVLVIGGTAADIGGGQTYIRKEDGSAGDWQRAAVLGGAAIVDIASDSTSLVTRFYRTDTASDAGGTTDRTPDWGGVTILALDDTWNYARYSRDTTLNPPPVSWADVVWEANDEQDTGFSRTSGVIDILNTGQYLVAYTIPIQKSPGTGGAARTEWLTRLTLDDTVVEGSFVSTYIRGNEDANDGVLSYVGLIDVTATTADELAVEMFMSDGTATANTMDADSNMQIWELPSGHETIILEATTGEHNPSTVTEFAWDTTAHEDSSTFTHTNPTDSFFEVDVDGDYLFFASQQTTNGGVRTFFSERFSVNDTISNYAAGGQYNRGSGADQAGAAFGSMILGLTAGDDISLENLFIEVDHATQTSNHDAMSGLHLQSIIPDPVFTQNDYRWYTDSDAENVTDPWGSANIAENTAITLFPAANNAPNEQQELRLRVNMTIGTGDLGPEWNQFKLQFKTGTDENCTTGSWTDVGPAQTWEYATSGVTDGANLSTTQLSASDVAMEYAKSSPTDPNNASATTTQDVEYDFHIIGTNTAARTTYSFRIVEDDNTLLDTYTTCPTLTTAPTVGDFLRHGKFYDNDARQGYFWAK